MQKAVSFIRENTKRHLDWAIDLCRIPSVSTKPEHKADVARAVQWTRDLCEKIGLKARIIETARHPAVYAERCDHPGRPVYLVYGHVDVQPTGDLALWDAGPFEPTLKDGWLVCRGSSDDKGQALLYLRAVEAWLKAEGRLPINLKLLIEGEEEIGSPNLGKLLEEHRDLLKCDTILISDTGMHEDGLPTITLGTRGLVYKEVRLQGPKHDLHSGTHGGPAPNPATILAQLIASLHDPQTGRVTIPGFYEHVQDPTPEERRAYAALNLDPARYAADLGVAALAAGEKGWTPQEQRSIRPTLEVNGIFGGYMGEGANTIIPARVGAKISMRLVPNQPAEEISRAFDAHVHKTIEQLTKGRGAAAQTVKVEIVQHGPAVNAYITPTGEAGARSPSRADSAADSHPASAATAQAFAAARRSLEESFNHEVALVREGGSLPILPMFKRVLGADSLMLGFASPSCNAHGPNEKVLLRDLDRGAEAIARLFGHLGSLNT